MKKTLAALLMLAIIAVGSNLTAKDAPVPDHKITEWSLGEIISGPEVKLGELDGKIVAIEFWGRRCPPCLASLPKLAKLDKRYRDKGLVIIGVHAQGGTKEEILEVVKDKKVEFTITTNAAHGPIKFSGIPKLFIFDSEGKLVFDGYPDRNAEKMIKSLVRKLPK